MKKNLEMKVSQIVTSSMDALPSWASEKARAAEGFRAAVYAETFCDDLRGGTWAGVEAMRAARKHFSLDATLRIEASARRKAMARKAMASE